MHVLAFKSLLQSGDASATAYCSQHREDYIDFHYECRHIWVLTWISINMHKLSNKLFIVCAHSSCAPTCCHSQVIKPRVLQERQTDMNFFSFLHGSFKHQQISKLFLTMRTGNRSMASTFQHINIHSIYCMLFQTGSNTETVNDWWFIYLYSRKNIMEHEEEDYVVLLIPWTTMILLKWQVIVPSLTPYLGRFKKKQTKKSLPLWTKSLSVSQWSNGCRLNH